MKAAIVLIVLVIVGGVVLYYVGGYSSFDPTQRGRDAKAAIAVGMPWTQVLNAAGDPRQYAPIAPHRERNAAGTWENELRPGPPIDFNRVRFEQRMANNELPDGFVLMYYFSPQAAFTVEFDKNGAAVGIADQATIADLLDSRQK
jgi:hypothetical protein